MFLTISTTGTPERPATDLGFLLHKHPDRAQTFSTAHGTAHVLYPEASAERCTAALLLEVDPVALVRRGRGKGRGGAPDAALAQYVNDRPYAASSLLAVALSTVFKSALRGVCAAMPERAASPLPLRIEIPAVPARGGAELVGKLFGPLGWTSVEARPVALDERFPQWGESRYTHLVLEGELRLADALRQLYVLLPVLDDAKHYWVAPDEVDKLLRAGDGWLAGHPEQKLITSRYLARRWSLTRQAMERLELVRLAEADDMEVEALDNAVVLDDPAEETEEAPADGTPYGSDGPTRPNGPNTPNSSDSPENSASSDSSENGSSENSDSSGSGSAAKEPSLADQRRDAILTALRDAGAGTVLDLGCGEGRLVRALLKDARFTRVVGVDVSVRALTIASRRLGLERLSERQAARVTLVQGALTYTDKRLKGYDAAVLSEVVEHVDPPRLPALEYAVFGAARPRTVLVTTPNAEYNVRWETLPAGHVRHSDHRFEWTREGFHGWADAVARRHGYTVAYAPVGPDDPEVGPPTQMAVFSRREENGHQEGKAA
ncbi:3' terminal RNA ribose 2'-O-methyltransferase Hen1 [Streptomyces sp. GMY02]|uniref:3' terminal RNA ribose 2'-O-methyltransferase Hen1 n=1 Tax=Streptomyces sp. GMY02 TaxID=1333528 RepID=UPI001C2C68E2|nr:3' terminal RNA ribose 2'-O-methyltransferase Hen1 [Streptomyces sp. GMY02]QXE34208.1 3' terminal RNA ribose 2'-O-methyltransferase Hen1 [Streptomyces sp. GMY02]